MTVYSVHVEIKKTLPNGDSEIIAHESRNVSERGGVRNALRSALDNADSAWRSHSWDEEQEEQQAQRKRRGP